MHGDVIVPRGGVEPDSSAPFGLGKFIVDDRIVVLVGLEGANLRPSLTVLRALQIELFHPLIVLTTALGRDLGDELALTTEVHLQELVRVIETSAP